MSSNAKSLNEGLVKAYLEAFKLVDPNQNFLIEPADYFTIMENLGVQSTISPAEFTDLLYGTDVDNQRTIGFADFADTLGGLKQEGAEDIAATFSIFDRDGNQSITRENLVEVLGSFNVSLTDEEMDALFTEGDKDKDGSLSLTEFLEVVNYADRFVRKNGLPPGADK